MWLAIETGYGACSVALIDGDGVVAARHEIIGRGHAERLVPLVAELLGETGGLPSAIAVDVGPGSFTGIRVGIAAARAFGLVWRLPVKGFSSTALVAAAAFAADTALRRVSVAMDAGRGEVFFETFDRDLVSEAPPAALSPAEALRIAAATIAGTAAPALAAAGSTAAIVSVSPPNAADAARLPAALRNLAASPIYIRAPDARLPAA